jgi:predicted  nucleic acid-binding Zn-ribbon protein
MAALRSRPEPDAGEAARLQAALEAAQAALTEAEAASAAKDEIIGRLEGDLAAMTADRNRLQGLLTEATGKLAAAEARAAELGREAEPSAAASAAAAADVARLTTERDGIQAELDNKTGEAERCAAELARVKEAADAAAASAAATIDQLRTDLANANARAAKAAADLAAAQREFADKDLRLQQAEQDFETLSGEMVRLRSELVACRQSQTTAAAATAAAGTAAAAAQQQQLRQAQSLEERLQAQIRELQRQLDECNAAKGRAMSQAEKAAAQSAEALQQRDVSAREIKDLNDKLKSAQADTAAAQQRSTASAGNAAAYDLLLRDLGSLARSIQRNTEFYGTTQNENFQTILTAVANLRKPAAANTSPGQSLCMFAYFVNFYMHAIFYKGDAKVRELYQSIDNLVNTFVAGDISANIDTKENYYKLLTALIPYVNGFEQVIMTGDSWSGPPQDTTVFFMDSINGLKALRTTALFNKRFGNDPMGYSETRGVATLTFTQRGSSISYGGKEDDITYDKLLAVFLVASVSYLQSLTPSMTSSCPLPEAITNPYGLFKGGVVQAAARQPVTARQEDPYAAVLSARSRLGVPAQAATPLRLPPTGTVAPLSGNPHTLTDAQEAIAELNDLIAYAKKHGLDPAQKRTWLVNKKIADDYCKYANADKTTCLSYKTKLTTIGEIAHSNGIPR